MVEGRFVKELIATIALSLGWEVMHRQHPGEAAITVGIPQHPAWTFDPVLIAAYTKAGMAKRGWCVREAHNAASCMQCFSPTRPVNSTRWYDYDRTDAMSEALAILQCIAEALEIDDAESSKAKETP